MNAPFARPNRNTMLKRSVRVVQQVAEAREAMSTGEVLYLEHHKGKPYWYLGSDTRVKSNIAKILIADPSIRPDDSGLFGTLGQSWRVVDTNT